MLLTLLEGTWLVVKRFSMVPTDTRAFKEKIGSISLLRSTGNAFARYLKMSYKKCPHTYIRTYIGKMHLPFMLILSLICVSLMYLIEQLSCCKLQYSLVIHSCYYHFSIHFHKKLAVVNRLTFKLLNFLKILLDKLFATLILWTYYVD